MNNKGGVAKTTTAMTLSQGLALRGYRVLGVDLDPQGNYTAMAGYSPYKDIEEDDTSKRLFEGKLSSLREVIRPSYWPYLDLVPAQSTLFGVEFVLPMRQVRERGTGFSFWQVLRKGLESDGLLDEYDVVVVDTSPAMSYLAMSAFGSADGVIVPVPAQGLEYASTVQFMRLFAELLENFAEAEGVTMEERRLGFFHILPSKVSAHVSHETAVLQWLSGSFGDLLLPTHIPESRVVEATGARFSTVYDISSYEGSREAFKRVRDAFDLFVQLIESKIRASWPSAVPAPTQPSS